jgi:stage II sporulation protein AA (anti-sigma F factor antagonist)
LRSDLPLSKRVGSSLFPVESSGALVFLEEESQMQEMKIIVAPLGSEENAVLVKVWGVIDTLTAPKLESTIEDLLFRQIYNIVIDLQAVDYISSAGWGTLIAKIREVRLNQGDIVLVGLKPNVHETFQLLELGGILTTCADLGSACGRLQIPLGRNRPKSEAHPSF